MRAISRASRQRCPGEKVDTRSAAAKAYAGHLRWTRKDVLGQSGTATGAVVYTYDVTFNGFAARLTPAEANLVEHANGVAHVWKNEILSRRHHHHAVLPRPRRRRRRVGEAVRRPGHAGEGAIVGVIDTGFWPESPSFAALPEPRPDAAIIAEEVVRRPATPASRAPPRDAATTRSSARRYYNAAGSAAGPDEFTSPRD